MGACYLLKRTLPLDLRYPTSFDKAAIKTLCTSQHQPNQQHSNQRHRPVAPLLLRTRVYNTCKREIAYL